VRGHYTNTQNSVGLEAIFEQVPLHVCGEHQGFDFGLGNLCITPRKLDIERTMPIDLELGCQVTMEAVPAASIDAEAGLHVYVQ